MTPDQIAAAIAAALTAEREATRAIGRDISRTAYRERMAAIDSLEARLVAALAHANPEA